MTHLLQIGWTDLHYTADEVSREVYTFPVHIRVLIGITLLFVVVILTLLAVIIGSRIYKTKRQSKRIQLRKKYQPVFTQLLFEDESVLNGDAVFGFFDALDLKTPFHREILIDTIVHLHSNFTGETAARLELLFVRLNFHRDAMELLKSKRWHEIAYAMRVLALMNVKESYAPLEQFLTSKNTLLRMESRVALMKLSDKDPLSFLSRETEPLTDWDMANIHAMLTRMDEPVIPDFREWLNSPNKTVVLFCVLMIGYFRQQDATELLTGLLDSPDAVLRKAVIKALRELNSTSVESRLITMFPQEETEIKFEILKTLEAIGKDKTAVFLETFLRNPVSEYTLSIQAVRSLLSAASNGKERLENILAHSEPRLELIVRHALDKRL